MNPKYAALLFTELIVKYIYTKNEEVYQELYSRLKFCGFDNKIIEKYIEYEIKLCIKRNIKFTKKLYDTFFWIKKINSNEKILRETYNHYLMIEDNNNQHEDTYLTISELCALMDEATYIDMFYKEKSNSVAEETEYFSESITKKSKFIIRKENAFRLMNIYEKTYNKEMPDTYIEMSDMFIKNEVQILHLCKWVYRLNAQNNIRYNWRPYTKEYYEFN